MKTIDLSRWARRQHFVPNLRDRNLDYPHYFPTANVNISRLIQVAKEKQLSVFHAILYVVMQTANEIQEFRYRIRGDSIVEAATLSVKGAPVIADELGCDDRIYITSIPWLSFTRVSRPIHMHPTDSVPRIAWGKFIQNGEQISPPLSVQVHHALADGVHVAKFSSRFEENCRRCLGLF